MENFRTGDLTRVMQCYGSTVMQSEPVYPPSSTSKEEGEAAHYLAKAVFNNEFQIEEMIDRKAPNGFYITAEMAEKVAGYVNEIYIQNGEFNEVDVATQFSGDGWIVSGRADHIALVGQTLYIDAFHYGFRIVPAEDNWSLIGHAIGFLSERNIKPASIVFTVHQPRGFRPKSIPAQTSMDYGELCKRYEQIAEHFGKKQRRCHTGPNCVICPHQHACVAFNSAGMNAVDVSEMPLSEEPEGEELAKLLDDFKRAQEIIKVKLRSLEESATHQINSGKVVPGYKAEVSEGSLKWNSGLTPEMIQLMAGIDVKKDQPTMITPTQAKTKYKISDAVLQTLARRETTNPKLTRVNVTKEAQRIFAKGKAK